MVQERRARARAGQPVPDQRRRPDGKYAAQGKALYGERVNPAVFRRLVLEAIGDRQVTQRLILRYLVGQLPKPLFHRGAFLPNQLGETIGDLLTDRVIATAGEDYTRVYFRPHSRVDAGALG